MTADDRVNILLVGEVFVVDKRAEEVALEVNECNIDWLDRKSTRLNSSHRT